MFSQNCKGNWIYCLVSAGVFLLAAMLQPAQAAYLDAAAPDAYWQLEETVPGSGVFDHAGTITGTCTEPACPGSTTGGRIGNAFAFNAEDGDEVVFAANSLFNFGSNADFSIELWMRLNGIPTARQVFIGRDDGTNSTQWWMGVNTGDGTAGAFIRNSDGGLTPATSLRGYSNVADNIWHHIVMVRDGAVNNLQIYVDGVLEGVQDFSDFADTSANFSSTADVGLGNLLGSGFSYDGLLDNVAVYSTTALSADTIRQNYLNGLNSHGLDEAFAPLFSGAASDTIALGFEAFLQARAAGNPLPTYASTDLPDGASIDAAGVITWLPSDTQTGANAFNVTATNGGGQASQAWSVSVVDLCISALDAYWKLEEAAQPYVEATGVVGNAVDGETGPTQASGKVGFGQSFAGGAEIVIPANAVFDWAAGADFSIELWMKLNGIPGTRQVFISRDDGTNSTQWWLGVNTDGTAGAYFSDSDGGSEPAVTLRGYSNVADNIWHHIVVVRDGTADNLQIYVDGVLEAVQDHSAYTSTDQSFAATADVTLGRLGGAYLFQGILDEIAFYSTALPTAIIAQHAGLAAGQAYCNGAPVIDSTATTTATEDVAYSYAPTYTDPEGHNIASWSLTTAPAGMTIDSATGEVTWTPLEGVTTGSVTIQAIDQYGATGTQSYTITVTAVNDAPVITTSAPSTATVGQLYSYASAATDVDIPADTLTWSLSSAPSGMSVNAATGAVSWTPGSAGDVTFTLTVSDGNGGTASEIATITVSGGSSGGGGGGGGGCFITSLR